MRGPSPWRNGRPTGPRDAPASVTSLIQLHPSHPGADPPRAGTSALHQIRTPPPAGGADSERVEAWRACPKSLAVGCAVLAAVGDRARRRTCDDRFCRSGRVRSLQGCVRHHEGVDRALRVHERHLPRPLFRERRRRTGLGDPDHPHRQGRHPRQRVTDRDRGSHLREGQPTRHGRPHRTFADECCRSHGSLGLVLEQQPDLFPSSRRRSFT